MIFAVQKGFKNKCRFQNQSELNCVEGFLMGSPQKKFIIQDTEVYRIQVMNPVLAYPLVSRRVMQQYRKMIAYLTELLVDDDDSGESCRIVLNQIEKFRLEIKNKYRAYLKKKELEMMSKQLLSLKKAAENRLIEIQKYYYDKKKENNRSK